jgi:hypothetical protein
VTGAVGHESVAVADHLDSVLPHTDTMNGRTVDLLTVGDGMKHARQGVDDATQTPSSIGLTESRAAGEDHRRGPDILHQRSVTADRALLPGSRRL